MNRFLIAAGWPLRQFARFTHAVFGNFTWQKPAWLQATGAAIRRRPAWSLVFPLVLAALATTGWWTWNWYSHLPKPLTIDWTTTLAVAGDPDDKFQSLPLTLTFDRSVARLEEIGKPAPTGITLWPAMKGAWAWQDGQTLIFTPTQDWPTATRFRIQLAPELFSPHACIETYAKDFRTAPLQVAISDLLFYVDPKDAATKQITATLTFSQPVDRASLEKNVTLAMESGANIFQDASSANGKCSFTYDKLDRIAYLRSGNVTVPEQSGQALLTLPGAVRAAAGGANLDDDMTGEVLVPSVSDLFHFNAADVVIATNADGDPEQALVLTTSVGVKPADLAKAIHAWVLPPAHEFLDPDTGKKVREWRSPAQVTADTLAKATAIQLTPVPSEIG